MPWNPPSTANAAILGDTLNGIRTLNYRSRESFRRRSSSAREQATQWQSPTYGYYALCSRERCSGDDIASSRFPASRFLPRRLPTYVTVKTCKLHESNPRRAVCAHTHVYYVPHRRRRRRMRLRIVIAAGRLANEPGCQKSDVTKRDVTFHGEPRCAFSPRQGRGPVSRLTRRELYPPGKHLLRARISSSHARTFTALLQSRSRVPSRR